MRALFCDTPPISPYSISLNRFCISDVSELLVRGKDDGSQHYYRVRVDGTASARDYPMALDMLYLLPPCLGTLPLPSCCSRRCTDYRQVQYALPVPILHNGTCKWPRLPLPECQWSDHKEQFLHALTLPVIRKTAATAYCGSYNPVQALLAASPIMKPHLCHSAPNQCTVINWQLNKCRVGTDRTPSNQEGPAAM